MPDQFVKRTFAEETEIVTGGAITWKDPPEIGLESVRGDGLLVVRRPEALDQMLDPWREARTFEEILVEVKMAGDHVDVPAVERTQLRRQARRVQRVEERGPPWLNAEPIWMVAPHVPSWLREVRKVRRLTRGCYRVEPSWSPFLWIAANDLPLRDDLVPFLVARSGKALDEFARWAATHRPLDWVLNMIEYTAMSPEVTKELLWGIDHQPVDSKVKERRRLIIDVMLEKDPEHREKLVGEAREKAIEEGIEKGIEKGIEQGIEKGIARGVEQGIEKGIARGVEQGIEKGIEKGRLVQERAALRRVLAKRRIVLNPDEEARIEACSSLATLERWLDQAVLATSASEALQDLSRSSGRT